MKTATNLTDTPADTDTLTARDWQAVMDIMDNPFLKPCERDGALLERGYKVVKV